MDPRIHETVEVDLPWGARARLVLYRLSTEAIRRQSHAVDVERSLTAFVCKTLEIAPMGRNIRSVRDQVSRLATANLWLGAVVGRRAVTVKSAIIDGFELWSPDRVNEKMLWPTTVRFSEAYYASLIEHAVPLGETAVRSLMHSAMALDIYTWLAQRLHRIEPGRPAFIPWSSLKEQFGQGYGRMNNFKRVFREMLARSRRHTKRRTSALTGAACASVTASRQCSNIRSSKLPETGRKDQRRRSGVRSVRISRTAFRANTCYGHFVARPRTPYYGKSFPQPTRGNRHYWNGPPPVYGDGLFWSAGGFPWKFRRLALI